MRHIHPLIIISKPILPVLFITSVFFVFTSLEDFFSSLYSFKNSIINLIFQFFLFIFFFLTFIIRNFHSLAFAFTIFPFKFILLPCCCYFSPNSMGKAFILHTHNGSIETSNMNGTKSEKWWENELQKIYNMQRRMDLSYRMNSPEQ